MGRRYVPLFWRLFIPNATVLAVACVILMIEPANGRVVALVGGLALMLAVTLLLMRWAFGPLARLTALMRDVDPLRPGQRIRLTAPQSELTVLVEVFNAMLDRLENERRESARTALLDREGERRRLATELHDEIGQTLTALALQLDRLRGRVPPDLRDEASDARDAVLASVEDVRRLAQRLRPEALDSLGLVPALTNLAERLSERTGLTITRNLDRNLPSLSPEAELVIYRVAQEALTNAIRHAQAQRVEVSLRASDGIVVLSVRDDGVGLDLSDVNERGIRGMRERALLLGAELQIGPAAEVGAEVRLTVKHSP